MSTNDSITAVLGITVGHWTDVDAATGCSVVLCPDGAVAAVDVRGGAPATRETDLLAPGRLVGRAHGISLSGGSAYGLDAASGVMRWLEEKGCGFPVTSGVVPIVPAASIYDLSVAQPGVRPDAASGYAACQAASSDPVPQGSIGAGAGATVAKALGIECAIKGGIGSALERAASGVNVGALVVVNCWGEVVDPDNGETVAGPRGEEPGSFVSTMDVLRERPPLSPFTADNSTIAVVATDAVLTKERAHRVAIIAHTGLARTIRPVHTPVDGDIVFALATGRNEAPSDVLQIGALAARAIERAVLNGVRQATALPDIPTVADWRQ